MAERKEKHWCLIKVKINWKNIPESSILLFAIRIMQIGKIVLANESADFSNLRSACLFLFGKNMQKRATEQFVASPRNWM
jgi:hypothetical protein